MNMEYQEIIPGVLYLGSEKACYEQEWPYILTVREQLPRSVKAEISHAQIPIRDSLGENIVIWLPHAIEFLENSCLVDQKPTLVHCQLGVCRSTAVVVAFLMKTKSLSFEDAYDMVKQARPGVEISTAFVEQIKQYFAQEHQRNNLMEVVAEKSFKRNLANMTCQLTIDKVDKIELIKCFELWAGTDIRCMEIRELLYSIISGLPNKEGLTEMIVEISEDEDLLLDTPNISRFCEKLLELMPALPDDDEEEETKQSGTPAVDLAVNDRSFEIMNEEHVNPSFRLSKRSTIYLAEN